MSTTKNKQQLKETRKKKSKYIKYHSKNLKLLVDKTSLKQISSGVKRISVFQNSETLNSTKPEK